MVRLLQYLAIFLVVGCAAVAITLTRHLWLPLIASADSEASNGEPNRTGSFALPSEQVQLSPQAQKNLGMTSKPLRTTTYWRAIEVPGVIVDRPGVSDRGVVAPVTAVISAIHHYAGDAVQPGQLLFTLRLVGDSFQASQSDLFKAAKDREIAQEHIDRLENLAQSGAVANIRLIELRNDVRRLNARINAARQELQLRGLSVEQIDAVSEGDFLSEVAIRVPPLPPAVSETQTQISSPTAAQPLPVFEVQDLTVELGQQVQAGEKLCTLSHHQFLFVEGRAFRQEVPLLQKAAEASLPIDVELIEEAEADWNAPIPSLVIHHISNTLDEKNRTVSFFLLLENHYRTYERDGQTLFLWRFRPGQQVRLRVDVEELEEVFVLPAAAVVREGPEFYVFRRNGDLFERKPVHVVHQTQQEVIIANDGSVPPGVHVAQTGAVQLNRVLKSQSDSAPSGVHVHADGSVHSDH